MQRKIAFDTGSIPLSKFLQPVRGKAGVMSPTVATKIDEMVAAQTIERSKRRVRKAIAAAPAPEARQDLSQEIREAQIGVVRSLRGEWDRLDENTQELLLEAIAGVAQRILPQRDYLAAIAAARKELKGPPTPPPRSNDFASGAQLSGGW